MEPTTIKIRHLDHLVLTTRDMPECLRFYQLLGFVCVDAQSRYELYANDFKINVHYAGNELEPKAYLAAAGTLDVCFEVHAPLATWQATLRNQGYDVTDIHQKNGCKGLMSSFYVRDPDQNLIELCCYDEH